MSIALSPGFPFRTQVYRLNKLSPVVNLNSDSKKILTFFSFYWNEPRQIFIERGSLRDKG